MKIDTLIAKLQKLSKQYGNCHVSFYTDTNWNGRCETIEAEDKGSVKAKLREKYGKIVVMSCYEISS